VCEEQAEKGATISPILIQLLLQKKINVAQASEKNNKAVIIKEIGYST
jgi:hypothetical protein